MRGGAPLQLPGTPVLAAWTGREEGDLGPAAPVVERRLRQQRVVARPWSGARQVHGAGVVVVEEPGASGGEADAMVSATPGCALSVLGADCATVAFASPQGVVGVAHAGWRGLVAGVVEATAAAMRGLGATDLVAAVGPCAHPECYEFSPEDLASVVRRLGPVVEGRTATGRPALDLPAGIAARLDAATVRIVRGVDRCTICAPEYYSHRGDGTRARQALVAWVA